MKNKNWGLRYQISSLNDYVLIEGNLRLPWVCPLGLRLPSLWEGSHHPHFWGRWGASFIYVINKKADGLTTGISPKTQLGKKKSKKNISFFFGIVLSYETTQYNSKISFLFSFLRNWKKTFLVFFLKTRKEKKEPYLLLVNIYQCV